MSPGEMVVLFGTLLGLSQLAQLQLDGSGKLSTTLATVQVYFGSVPAPLIYVSATQSAVMVPYEVAGSSSTQVVVHYEGLVSQPYTVAVAPTAPGIFSANASAVRRASPLAGGSPQPKYDRLRQTETNGDKWRPGRPIRNSSLFSV